MNMESRENNKKFSINRFFRSFKFSWEGLKYAYKYEQSMTIHFVSTVLTIILGFVLNISLIEWIICILTLGFVMVAELLNTAIEAIVDLASPKIHPLAKISKDTASAAVAVYSFITIFCLSLIFIPKIIALL